MSTCDSVKLVIYIMVILYFSPDYLGNVLEDLGLNLSDQLSQLSTLLRIPADDYQAQSSGCQPKLVAAVRQMREITST